MPSVQAYFTNILRVLSSTFSKVLCFLFLDVFILPIFTGGFNPSKKKVLGFAIALIGLLFVFFVSAQEANAVAGINRTINFQGKLVNNPAKTNVTDTSYTVIFTIYDNPSGATALWTETQSVTTADGIFRATLGSVTAFPSDFNFNWDGLYLGMKVNSDSEMTPRIRLTAVPYALNSQRVAGLTVQDDTGNASTSATLRIANGKTVTISNGLTFTGTDTTSFAFPSTGGNVVTEAFTQSLTNKTIGSTGLTFSGATTDIATVSNEDLTVTPNGSGNIVLTGDFDSQVLIGASGATTEFPLLIRSGIGSNAALAVDNLNSGDLFTASASGVSKFTIANNGNISFAGGQASAFTTLASLNTSAATFTIPSTSSDTFCLLTLANCGGGSGSNWNVSNGTIFPKLASTLDLLIGGTSTASAKFAVLNVNSGTPTASISANANSNATYLTGSGSLQTVRNNTLIIGGDTTGNVSISPNNGGAGSLLTVSAINQAWSGTTTLTASSLATITSAATLGVSATTLTFGGDSAATLSTVADDNLTLTANGTGDLRILSDADTDILFPEAAFITEDNSLLYTGAAGKLFALTSTTAGQCVVSAAANNVPTWATCPGGGSSNWDVTGGVITPKLASTLDFLLGSTATSSAEFGVTGINDGTPTATISATTGASSGNGISLTGSTATIQSLRMNTLTLGGASTGNIVIDSGSGVVNLADATASRFILTDASKNLAYTGLSSVLLDTLTDETGTGVSVFGTSPAITTSLTTGSTTFALVNTTATTVNFAGAATTLNIGGATGTAAIANPTLELGGTGAATIQTNSNDDLTLTPNGTGNLILTGDFDTQVLIGATGATTEFPLIVRNGIGNNAALAVDNLNSGDIFTASASGTTRFSITSAGGIKLGTSEGSSNNCLLSGGVAAAATWNTCPGGSGGSNWTLGAGFLTPNNSTVDLLIGGQATASAKFAVLNVAGGTPTASISGNSGDIATYLTGDGTLATTNRQTLTIGNSSAYDTTGNLLIHPNGTGKVGIGTTTPALKLSLSTTAQTTDGIRLAGSDSRTLDFRASMGNNNNNTIVEAADSGIIFHAGSVDTGAFVIAPWVTAGESGMRMDATGKIGFGTSAAISELHVTRPLASGATGKALAIFDQIENQDIFTASASGTTRFSITSAGGIKLGTSEGSSNNCLLSGGAGVAAAWNTCPGGSGGSSNWTLSTTNGTISPNNGTVDLVLGFGTSAASTASAKFSVTNLAGALSPTASLSATTDSGGNGNGLVFNTSGNNATIQALRNNTLTIGGGTTGNIVLRAGEGIVFIGENEVKNGGLTFYSSGVGIADPTITVDASGNLTIQATQTGASVIVGDGSGNISLSLTAAADVLIADKTVTLGGTYTGDDFTFKRIFTGGANTQSGSVLKIHDISGGSGTINGDLLLVNSALTSGNFTGNLAAFQQNGVTKLSIQGSGTSPVVKITGLTSSAGLVVNNAGVGDLLTASASGATKFTLSNSGSASMSGGLTIDSAGSIQTTKNQTLTIGGSTTGDISLQSNNNGTGKVKIGTGNGGTTTPDLFGLDVKSDTGDPTGFEGAMYYNTQDNKFRCYQNTGWTDCIASAPDTATFTDANPAAWAGDVNTVQLFNDATKPNIITDSATSTVMVSLNIEGSTSDTSADTFLGARLVFTTDGNDPSCTTSAQVGEDMISSYAITTSYNFSNIDGTFVHTPGVAGTIKYTVCSSAAGGPTQSDTALSINVSLIELGADLAENYYTKDDTLGPGDVVSIDPSLPAGVKKTTRSYDPTTIGVVSTNPGKVLDDAIGLGKGRAVPIALAGRIPVKVSSENGRVKAGDYLTPSSQPGIAMKATKAGQIIGQALENFSYLDSDIGLVTTFVKTSYFTGESVISQFPGLSIAQKTGENALSNLSQANLILLELLKKDGLVTYDLSEIFTDRVVAGLEIITPRVIAQDVDVAGLLTAKDASISGILTADVIKANKIDLPASAWQEALQAGGLEFAVRDQVLSMTDLFGAGVAMNNVSEETENGGLMAQVKNLFGGFVEFLGQVIFRNDVEFEGEVAFNSDTAGFAKIKKGQKFVEVVFEKEYKNQPVVNISTQVFKLTDESFRKYIDDGFCTELEGTEVCQDKITDKVLSGDLDSAVHDLDTKGFMIFLNQTAPIDVTFSWQATAVKNVKTVINNGPAGLVLPFIGDYTPSNKFGEHSEDPKIKDKDLRLGLKGHDGLDIAVPFGTSILAVDDGEVEAENNGYGMTIVIKHTWGKTTYGHLSERLVKVGDKVTKGQKIALSGNSGLTTGPHLHFGITLNKSKADNGYAGFENPWHFLSFRGSTPKNGAVAGVSTKSASLSPSITPSGPAALSESKTLPSRRLEGQRPSPTLKPENTLLEGLTLEE